MGTFIRSLSTSSVAVLCLLACGGDPAPANDAATPRDSGGGVDSGALDSGSDDSGMTADVGLDAPMTVDSGPVDAGPPPEGCAITFSGCTTFEDHTGDSTVALTIVPDGATFAYEPHCIRVSTGTVVTIPAEAIHPLVGATCSPETGDPLPTVPTVTTGDYTFTATGAYGFFCNVHGTNTGAGMAGLIVVE